MGFENSAGLGVNNHYGPRTVGGSKGELPSAGAVKELEFNFDDVATRGELLVNPELKLGDVVLEVVTKFATVGTLVATAGGNNQNIALADGSAATYVTVDADGPVLVSGVTAGSVIVRYMSVAQDCPLP